MGCGMFMEPFKTYGRYANGVEMTISGEFQNGIKWYGTEGWIFVQRDGMNSPTAKPGDPVPKVEVLQASDPKILTSVIGPNEVHLYTSDDQHGNWLDCIRSRKHADRAAGDWAPRVLDLPVALDCHENQTTPALGPEGGALHQ